MSATHKDIDTTMRHCFGLNEYQLRQQKKQEPVYYDPSVLINGHVGIFGMSGTGKTFQSVRMMDSATESGIELDVMDVHDELHVLRGCKAVRYSQATGYGFNPLVLDADPHTGGVYRQADFLVGLIREVTTQFGSKQEAALRNAIIDCYFNRGVYPDNPRSWARKQLTDQQRKQMQADRRWSELRDYYPTLQDLLEFIDYKVKTLKLGGNNKVQSLLDAVEKSHTSLQKQLQKSSRAAASGNDEEKTKLEGRVEAATQKWKEAFEDYVSAGPGRELSDMIKYDSDEVLISVRQRLEILTAAGIFNANEPPFGDSRVRVHQIKSLSTPQQILFVKLRLRAIFEKCKRMGPTASGTELRHVVFLDEAPKYFSDDDDDIINIISREGRKFGLGLWCAAQEPTSFPQAFITNCGAKILLGIDSSFWKGTIQKMRATEDGLKYIKAKEVISVKLHAEGKSDPPFVNVVVPNPATYYGRVAEEYEKKAA